MKRRETNYTFAIVLTALMIATSVLLKLFTPYFPIGGAFVLRLDFYGPFEKLVGVLFGPIFGGIAGGLVDFLGYFLANRTPVGFIPQLTLVAILNVMSFAFLWHILRRVKSELFEIVYLFFSGGMLIFGVINTAVYYLVETGGYRGLLDKFGGNIYFLTIVSIIIGIVGLVIYVVNIVIKNNEEKSVYAKYFLKIFVALVIPGIVFSLINTKVLMMFIPSLSDKNYLIFALPRLVAQMIETLYEAYVMSVLLVVGNKLFAGNNIDVSVE